MTCKSKSKYSKMKRRACSKTVGGDVNRASRSPRARLSKTEEGWLIQVALPGISREQLSLEAQGDSLILSAQSDTRSYERTFRLPYGQEVGEVTASHEAGILTIQLAPLAPVKRHVKVQPA